MLESSSPPALVSEPTLRPRVTRPAWRVDTRTTAAESRFDTASETYICSYCNVSCNSENQFNEHCSSSRHKLNVNSDKERDWNCRPPPPDVTGGKYCLCERFANLYSRNNLGLISSILIHFKVSLVAEINWWVWIQNFFIKSFSIRLIHSYRCRIYLQPTPTALIDFTS